MGLYSEDMKKEGNSEMLFCFARYKEGWGRGEMGNVLKTRLRVLV